MNLLNASRKRALCDCGKAVKRYVNVDTKTGALTESYVYCEKCRQHMERVVSFDDQTWKDIRDPKKVIRGLRD
jgi:hypothetical protein